MTAKFISSLAISIVTIAALSGCATTARQVRRDAQVSAAMLDEAQYQMDSTRQTNALLCGHLTVAQRSIDEGSVWPSEADELKFDADRLAALERSMQS